MKYYSKIIRKALPPILTDIVTKVFYAKKKKYGFCGKYTNWELAVQQTTGWETSIILEKIKQSTNQLEIKNDSFERDGEIISSSNQNYPIMYSILNSVDLEKRDLKIIDFGGSLGTHYYRYKPFINNTIKVLWAIIEQKKYVDIAKSKNNNPEIIFHYSISEAKILNNYDTFFSSGTLQYIEKPYDLINEITNHKFSHIIFDRLFFIDDIEEQITTQSVDPNLFYEASFPVWLFNEMKFKNYLTQNYNLISEFKSEDDDNEIEGKRIYHKGFYFKIKNN